VGIFTEVTEATFQNRVLESSVPVLVEFGAVWCGPCKMLEPVLTQLEDQLPGRLRVALVDVDANVRIAMRYRVGSVPTLILFIKGEPRDQWTGYQSRERILELLSRHLHGI
jgi:thioredoxin 1